MGFKRHAVTERGTLDKLSERGRGLRYLMMCGQVYLIS